MLPTIEEILSLAKKKYGTDKKICNAAGLTRTTLWRIKNGTTRASAKTVGKLMKAARG